MEVKNEIDTKLMELKEQDIIAPQVKHTMSSLMFPYDANGA